MTIQYQPYPYRVYVAGPISKGDLGQNVRYAIDIANILVHNNIAPFVPHLQSVSWALINPPNNAKMINDYKVWLRIDFAFIKVCDALYRIPGESIGSDREVEFATKHGIPVFYAIGDLLAYFRHKGLDNAIY